MNAPASVRVLIVDEHPVARAGYRRFLGSMGISAVGEAPAAAAALHCLRAQRWDVVLFDIRTADFAAFEALQAIVARHPTVRILVTSALPEAAYALNVLKCGALGFFPKSGDFDAFARAVTEVVSGRCYVSDALAELMARSLISRDRILRKRLSGRESQVLRGLALGASRTRIAAELRINPKTIGTYRSRALKKLGSRSTEGLVDYAQPQAFWKQADKAPEVEFTESNRSVLAPTSPDEGAPKFLPAPLARAPHKRRRPAGRPRGDLIGQSILIVEDDFYQARDLQQALQHAGAKVLGPFVDSVEALQCIARRSTSCAVVDLQLRDGFRFEVPRALRNKGVPLLVLTGFGSEIMPEDLGSLSRIEKPADIGAVVAALARMSLRQRVTNDSVV